LNEARAFVLFEPTPSEADIRITRDLIRVGQILNIEVLHHIVIDDPNHTSLRSLCYFLLRRIMPSCSVMSGGNLRHQLCFALATRHYIAATRIINQADDVLVPLHAYTGNVSPNIGFPLLDCS